MKFEFMIGGWAWRFRFGAGTSSSGAAAGWGSGSSGLRTSISDRRQIGQEASCSSHDLKQALNRRQETQDQQQEITSRLVQLSNNSLKLNMLKYILVKVMTTRQLSSTFHPLPTDGTIISQLLDLFWSGHTKPGSSIFMKMKNVHMIGPSNKLQDL